MSTITKNVLYGFEGFLASFGVSLSYQSTQSVAQGETAYLAYMQARDVTMLANQFFHALKEVNVLDLSKTKRHWYSRFLGYPIPFALQILHYNLDVKKYPLTYRTVTFLRDHVNKVVFVLHLGLIGFFTYTTPVFAIGMAIGFTAEIIKDHTPQTAKTKKVWEITFLVLNMACFICDSVLLDFDFWDVFEFAGWLSLFVWEHYFEKNSSHQNSQITITEAKKIINTPIEQLSVNKEHLKYNPHLDKDPSSLDVDITKTMDALIAKVVWNQETYRAFKEKLFLDNRFIKKYPELKSVKESFDELKKKEKMSTAKYAEFLAHIPDKVAKETFEKGARAFANQIASSAIEVGGVFIRYEDLQSTLRSVLKSLSEDPDFTADLFQLSLEGGEYCGTGIVATISDVYKRRGGTLDKKISSQLRFMRERQFYAFYYNVVKKSSELPKGIVDSSDPHFHNFFLFYFDKFLKLHSETLENDLSTESNGFCNRLYRFVMTQILDLTFWEKAVQPNGWYAPQTLVSEVSSPDNILTLNVSEVSARINEWLETLPESTERETLYMELTENESFFGTPLHTKASTESKKVVNPQIVKFLLCIMGVLKKEPFPM